MVRAIKKIKRKTARIIVKRRLQSRHKLTVQQDKARRKRLSTLLLIMAGCLVFFPSFMWLRYKFARTPVRQEVIETNQELFLLGNMIYRQYIGYGAFCQKQGVHLVFYPKAFYDAHQDELFVFGHAARQSGFTPDKILEKAQKEFAAVSESSIQKEFNKLIHKRIQDETGTVIQTHEELCRYIDAAPAKWFERQQTRLEQIRSVAGHLKVLFKLD